jgi:hypothetical protein
MGPDTYSLTFRGRATRAPAVAHFPTRSPRRMRQLPSPGWRAARLTNARHAARSHSLAWLLLMGQGFVSIPK